MSGLSSLSPAQADLVAGFPYRVGIWMSNLDIENAPEAKQREVEALAHVLDEASRRHDVVGAIARETLKRKSHWPAWRDSAPGLLQDCAATLGVLNQALPHGDAKAIGKWVFGIAVAVAEAYGEFSSGEDHTGAIGRTMNRVTEFISGHIPSGQPSHISPKETAALERLKSILGV